MRRAEWKKLVRAPEWHGRPGAEPEGLVHLMDQTLNGGAFVSSFFVSPAEGRVYNIRTTYVHHGPPREDWTCCEIRDGVWAVALKEREVAEVQTYRDLDDPVRLLSDLICEAERVMRHIDVGIWRDPTADSSTLDLLDRARMVLVTQALQHVAEEGDERASGQPTAGALTREERGSAPIPKEREPSRYDTRLPAPERLLPEPVARCIARGTHNERHGPCPECGEDTFADEGLRAFAEQAVRSALADAPLRTARALTDDERATVLDARREGDGA
jgi:hypothetical protein